MIKYWVYHRVSDRRAFLFRETEAGEVSWATMYGSIGWTSSDDNLQHYIDMANNEMDTIIIPLEQFNVLSHFDFPSKTQYNILIKERFYKELLDEPGTTNKDIS
jgi:hypothetical protein